MRQDALTAIATISRRAKWLLAFLFLAAAAGTIYVMWRMAFDLAAFSTDLKMWLGVPVAGGPLSRGALSALIALGVLNAAIGIAALLTVWRLFDLLEKGRVFSRRTGELLRLAGGIALIGAASTVLSRTLAALIASYDNPAGQRILLIGVSGSEVMLLLLAALLFAMGHVIALASEIERENRSFV